MLSSISILEQQSVRVLLSSSNMPQWRHSFLLTVLTVPPSKSLTFIVCLVLWDELNPQSHWLILSRWRMAFSAAYQMSLGFSVVVASIHRGWITLIKAIFALRCSTAQLRSAGGIWVLETWKQGKLQTKELILMWSGYTHCGVPVGMQCVVGHFMYQQCFC